MAGNEGFCPMCQQLMLLRKKAVPLNEGGTTSTPSLHHLGYHGQSEAGISLSGVPQLLPQTFLSEG
ncbi:hypothetical protein AFE_1600 [Acidithiobacillus ferrooxidans ATCC 23270]|uniref:Uncharacterized protein n=1 Tax=Acidithiobacillus ferrooxidans (strain ATCC 23270 / DSM 14882 / CIP 104768 / NCIMB 8455) TaxID=243159 RepID=B7JAU2_ACIF2|nr:hypothetical protein AFE_1600 [Acidithiobacillus ferrooxidans ATCC 23270]